MGEKRVAALRFRRAGLSKAWSSLARDLELGRRHEGAAVVFYNIGVFVIGIVRLVRALRLELRAGKGRLRRTAGSLGVEASRWQLAGLGLLSEKRSSVHGGRTRSCAEAGGCPGLHRRTLIIRGRHGHHGLLRTVVGVGRSGSLHAISGHWMTVTHACVVGHGWGRAVLFMRRIL